MSDDKDRALEKIRKLLAMGVDGRGNIHEAEAAMRQAQALMRKFNIESADEVLADLKGGKDMLRDSDSPFAYPSKNRPTKVPSWVGVVAVGVGALCVTKCDIIMESERGARVRFSGYGPDVQFSKWLYRYLIELIHQLATAEFTTRGDREAFRYSCACAVQARIMAMVAEQARQDEAEAKQGEALAIKGMSTALVIMSTKLAAVQEAFGEQGEKTIKRDVSADANRAGMQAGHRLNIPTARPVGHSSNTHERIS